MEKHLCMKHFFLVAAALLGTVTSALAQKPAGDPKGGISAEEVAVMVNTINYEVTCDISRRAHTFYLNR